MSGLTFRPATSEDAAYLAPRLRAWDVEEIKGAWGEDIAPRTALEQSIGASAWALVALDQGEPVWLIGVAPTPEGFGCPWLVGTDAYARKKKSFYAHTRRLAEQMAREYEVLINYVGADNELSKAWLPRLGFEIRPERIRLRNGGIPFNIFVRFS